MPNAINDRNEELLVNKHNEALLTMPLIFSDAGYDVTVFDPPYAGYSHYPDLSVYEPYPKIKAYVTECGQFLDTEESDSMTQSGWKRNFFCYSLMKSCPLFIQPILYSNGSYFSSEISGVAEQHLSDNSVRYTVSPSAMTSFSASYNALGALSSMTKTDASGKNHFFLLQK